MANIFVNTDDLSGKLLDRAIEELETANEKMSYNYSADAYLEVAIERAKYNSPTGIQRTFTAKHAECAGTLAGRIENVLRKLSDLKSILQKCPDELCEIDERQKGEISNLWWRSSYYLKEPGNFFATLFGIGCIGSEVDIVLLTDEDRDRIASEHPFAKYVLTKEQIDDIKKNSYSETELNEKLQQAVVDNGKVPVRPYDKGVSQGSIRYCSQVPDYRVPGMYKKNGWSNTDKDSSGWMCNRACESMALSYIGIDQSPSSMHDSDSLRKLEFALGIHNGHQSTLIDVAGNEAVVQANGKTGFDRGYLDSLVRNFEQDNGIGASSPVMIRYTNGESGSDERAHWILLLKNNGDGSYQAIGPWSEAEGSGEMREFIIDIGENGRVSGSGFSHSGENCYIHRMCQYTRPDIIES